MTNNLKTFIYNNYLGIGSISKTYIVNLDPTILSCFQALWYQWSVKVWKPWLWQPQKITASSRLTFPRTKQSLPQRTALQNLLVAQISFMPQTKTNSLKLWREKRKTLAPFPLLLASSHRVHQTKNARLPTCSVHQKPLTFLCLGSGVWHLLATMFLFSPSSEFLSCEQKI